MEVCIIGGAGYVGLITGVGLAELGNRVVCVDLDGERLRRLRSGESPILENGIGPILARNLAAGRLTFSPDLRAAFSASEVAFIAVGTPSQDDGQADLSQVIQVAEEAAACVDLPKTIVIKSTVPVGTLDLVRSIFAGAGKREGDDFDLVVNPEFLREGRGLHDFFYPDRIVVGARAQRARDVMRSLYAPIVRGDVAWRDADAPEAGRQVPVVETDLASAQMVKYASNAFLATRVSFINEIARLCERVGADVVEVARGMGYDPRIGHAYLQAGLGFGGPCLEKDLRALLKINAVHEARLLESVLYQNERQMEGVLGKLQAMVGYPLYRKIVAVLGLSFKGGTNDVRNSLALRLVARLEQEGASVRAYDPAAVDEAKALHPASTYYDDPYEAVVGADGLVIATDWPEFRALDFSRIKERMASPRVLDARNLLDGHALRQGGFAYVGIGRFADMAAR